MAGVTVACAGDTPRQVAAPARQTPPSAANPAAPDVEPIEVVRAEVPPPVVERNPFRFERRGGDTPRDRSLPPADALPELPFPVPPPLRLLGIATEEDGQRVAVISSAGDLVLARVGDRLAGGFSVARIAPDGVELGAPPGGRALRLSLP